MCARRISQKKKVLVKKGSRWVGVNFLVVWRICLVCCMLWQEEICCSLGTALRLYTRCSWQLMTVVAPSFVVGWCPSIGARHRCASPAVLCWAPLRLARFAELLVQTRLASRIGNFLVSRSYTLYYIFENKMCTITFYKKYNFLIKGFFLIIAGF